MIDKFQNWVRTTSGKTAIWANPNAPAPDRPYLSLSIISIIANGSDEQGLVVDGKQKTIGYRTANVRITYYAKNPAIAAVELELLRSKMRTEAAKQELLETNISLLNDPVITNIPQLLQAQWQPQAALDVAITFGIETERDMDWFDKVQGEAGIEYYGAEYTQNFEVEI